MTAILPLPEPGDEILSVEALARLTGAVRRDLQIEWLKKNRWYFNLNRGGDPIVGRLYANLKLSGVEVKTIVQQSQWEPPST
ncbi:DUF4224 domain-containing protein [Roseateles sp.]|uniref:DUF4224 domain-containing protein n=1 Tax=Roseateles sp. TaxID=1971397 RepID=UPI0031DE3A05